MSVLAKDRAIILETRALRESDLLVILLTRGSGKLTAVARGARRSKKRFMGGLDMFTCGTVELRTSKKSGALPTLESMSEREVWLGLRGNLTRFSLASFCAELANTFSPDGDAEGSLYFTPLTDCLAELNCLESQALSYGTVIYFTLTLLALGGYNPLDGEIDLSKEERMWWQSMILGDSLEQDRCEEFGKQSFRRLSSYTEHVLGQALKSPQLLRVSS